MELWELTYIQYCNNWLENSKYKKAYKASPEKWESKKRDLLQDWINILYARAEIGSISEKVIRSYVNLFGEKDTRRIFRGTKEKGLYDWEQTQIKKIYRDSELTNIKQIVYSPAIMQVIFLFIRLK